MKYLPMFFMYGIIFGAGPCCVSCGALFLSYLGSGIRGVGENLKAYLWFSLARLAVYVILGISVFGLGSFAAGREWDRFFPSISLIGGFLITAIGIASLAGRLVSCEKLCRFKGSAAMLGAVIGLLPCAPLLAVLSYLGLVAKSWKMSAAYSFSFGLGTALSPLLLLAVFAGFLPRLKNARILKVLNFFCSLILTALGMHLIIKGL